MEEVTKILPFNEAAKLQTEAGNYDCRITDLAVVGGGNARISVAGTDENLKTLFDNVKIPLDNENKRTTTVWPAKAIQPRRTCSLPGYGNNCGKMG